mmetsp:Transcript_68285/g.172114  ORF Transcript_68285/g.172114 Transcript_68285/m.172114 type:complete len:274 (-) Transcript_68285:523-1344(-)
MINLECASRRGPLFLLSTLDIGVLDSFLAFEVVAILALSYGILDPVQDPFVTIPVFHERPFRKCSRPNFLNFTTAPTDLVSRLQFPHIALLADPEFKRVAFCESDLNLLRRPMKLAVLNDLTRGITAPMKFHLVSYPTPIHLVSYANVLEVGIGIVVREDFAERLIDHALVLFLQISDHTPPYRCRSYAHKAAHSALFRGMIIQQNPHDRHWQPNRGPKDEKCREFIVCKGSVGHEGCQTSQDANLTDFLHHVRVLDIAHLRVESVNSDKQPA